MARVAMAMARVAMAMARVAMAMARVAMAMARVAMALVVMAFLEKVLLDSMETTVAALVVLLWVVPVGLAVVALLAHKGVLPPRRCLAVLLVEVHVLETV